jgi:hypothetical protein
MTDCLVCSSPALDLVLDLGETALANNFITAQELGTEEPTYPLQLARCRDCGHVQLLGRVSPAEMFDTYLYVSSMSETLRSHLRSVAVTATKFSAASAGDLAVDIGSNDGTLLTGYGGSELRTLGVDPAANLAELAKSKGIEISVGYFGEKLAIGIRDKHGQAKIITATNSFPHIPALADYMKGVCTLLSPDGVFLIEAHYAGAMAAEVAFDTIYHEHVSYWLLAPMHHLMTQHNLEIVAVEHLPIHHGQARVYVCHKGTRAIDNSVRTVFEKERSNGFLDSQAWTQFAKQTHDLKQSLHSMLLDIRADSKTVAGYGAPAKASTLLGFLGLGPADIPYIADRSPLKQGRYTPGTHIPIVAPEQILEEKPDYLVLFAWNFAEEIMEQLADYKSAGGKFVIPIPKVKILS